MTNPSRTVEDDSSQATPVSIEQANKQALVAWFRSGEHGDGARVGGKLGVEVEHFIVTEDGRPVSYEPEGGVIGVRDVLDHLERYFPERLLNSHGDLLGLSGEIGSVTLEPAAQLEISLAPYERIADVDRAYRRFRDELDPFLAQHGCKVVEAGYHPTRRALELPLIPKERYRFMNDYFAALGTHGERMMRASASTQVSVDYADEADAVRKLRAATALGPVLAAIADNVRVFEREPIDEPLARINLWRGVDNARCGVIPGLFDEGFGFASYADWLLGISPIFVTRPAADDPDGPHLRSAAGTTTARIYADAPITDRDVEHILSMVWPDARLKRFVEIRPADCLPPACMPGYAALVKGLFYRPESLAAIEEALGVEDGVWPIDEAQVERAIADVRAQGFDAQLYGRTLATWEEFLFELAETALPADERPYLEPLRAFAADKPWG